jgi:dephospho-CoA kinase
VVHRLVAERIFADRTEYDWLTGFLHPIVRAELEERLRRKGDSWAVVEIPLLFETGVAPWVTVKVFVTAPREARLERCRERGWDEAEMRRRESFFLPSQDRAARSDYVIRNDGDMETLKNAVTEIYRSEICPKEIRGEKTGGGARFREGS